MKPLTIKEWRECHHIDHRANPPIVYIALRQPRAVERRRLLTQVLRAHFTTLVTASSATRQADVDFATIELSRGMSEALMNLSMTVDGNREIATATMQLDALVRFLEMGETFVPDPETVVFDDIARAYMEFLYAHTERKLQELAGGHEHSPHMRLMRRMLRAALNAAQLAQHEPAHIANNELLRFALRPMAKFVALQSGRHNLTADPSASADRTAELAADDDVGPTRFTVPAIED